MRLSTRPPKPVDDYEESESQELVAWRMGLISPNGPNKVRWDWFVLMLVFYTSITLPLSLGFVPFNDWSVNALAASIDLLVDILYIVDIVVSWKTTYYSREGTLVLDKKAARAKYLKTWFAIDVFASFPYVYVALIFTPNPPPAIALPALAKLLRILRLGRKIDKLSSSKMFRIAQFTGMLLMAAHFYACIWFWMGGSQPPDPVDGMMMFPGERGTSWVYKMRLQNETIGMKYTASVYWSITTLMKSPWFHPTSPLEFLGGIFMIIFGCVLFAYFLGNVTAVITAANAAGGRYRGQIEQRKGFCRSQGLEPKLTDKLLVYQDAQWTETFGGTDRAAMLKTLPPHLWPKVTIAIYKPLMDACPFLYDCSAWGCTTFLQSLKVQVCDRGDHLLTAGSLCPNMYILQRGEIKINFQPEATLETAESHVPGGRVGGSKVVKQKMKDGKDAMRGRTDKMGTLLNFHDVFSKQAMLDYGVVSLTRCSLLMITRGELKNILTTFDLDKEHFDKAIKQAVTTIRGGDRRTSTRMGAMPNADAMALAQAAAGRDSSPPASQPGRNSKVGGGDWASSQLNNLLSPSNTQYKPGEGNSDIAALRRELAALRQDIEPMAKLLVSQSMMIEKLAGKDGMSA